MIKIKLDKLVDDITMQNEEMTFYLDKSTGETILITDEDESAAEDEEELSNYPEWQQETIKVAIKIINDTTDRYIPLPSEFEVHEYRIMEEFCESLEDDKIKRIIEIALHGSGAFRR